jgi:hypothetical protein
LQRWSSASSTRLDRDDFSWILKDCDHPTARLADKAFCRRLDPKGFWRVDKDQDPELRHTVLALAAFDNLATAIATAIAAAGDRDAGIQAFCDQHDGDGWMLPETLCLADLRATRTVDAGAYDERARIPQPVASRLGDRFLDWQLAQTHRRELGRVRTPRAGTARGDAGNCGRGDGIGRAGEGAAVALRSRPRLSAVIAPAVQQGIQGSQAASGNLLRYTGTGSRGPRMDAHRQVLLV